LDGQTDSLEKAGVEKIFTDKASGARDDREGLAELLAYLRPGDVVVVVALDRLGRSLSGVIQTLDGLRARGIEVKSLREGIDTSTSAGRMVAGIFATLAEYERTLIAERAAVAREAAILRGKRAGRKPVLSPEQVEAVHQMRAAGDPVRKIMAVFPSASRTTIYRLCESVQDSAR
jgi:DNA invertase Pin-like site-specific DNA recombinase